MNSFVKNNQSEILRNHRSFTCTDVDEADGSTYYINADVSVKDCVESHDYIRVRTSEFDYCRFTSGVLGRWVHFESDSCSWAGLSKDMLSEEVLSVEVFEEDERKECKVIVPNDQLSLAIGNKGQNAKLAAGLTGYRIDILPEHPLPADDADDADDEEEE